MHQNYYCLGKTISEFEALEYAKRSGLSMVTICPSVIIGPMLQFKVNASSLLLLALLKGIYLLSHTNYITIIDLKIK